MPNEDDKVKLPSAWAQKTTGPKKWTSTGRGDDPSLRKTHAPTKPGIGDGKAFFFLFGFKKASKIDQDMLGQELAQIDDDIATLCDAGYTVIVDPQGTKDDFLGMLYGSGEGAAGLVPA